MSADEDFLARWSRRKRAAAAQENAAPEVPAVAPPVTDQSPPDAASAGQNSEAEFDIASLPSIDSIAANSDIRDFLRAGVPADLTRAALRRAWVADPAIRDFVGLAENAWDFTDPNAIPGFGPLQATDDVRAMVAQIMSRTGEAAQSVLEGTSGETQQQASELKAVFDRPTDATGLPERNPSQSSLEPKAVATATPGIQSPAGVTADTDVAAQRKQSGVDEKCGKETTVLRRTHGTALPH